MEFGLGIFSSPKGRSMPKQRSLKDTLDGLLGGVDTDSVTGSVLKTTLDILVNIDLDISIEIGGQNDRSPLDTKSVCTFLLVLRQVLMLY